MTRSSVRLKTISQLVKADPTLLVYRGASLRNQMDASRVLEDEVKAAVRQQGIASMAEVEAVILETDGTIAVVKRNGATQTALFPVAGIQHGRDEVRDGSAQPIA